MTGGPCDWITGTAFGACLTTDMGPCDAECGKMQGRARKCWVNGCRLIDSPNGSHGWAWSGGMWTVLIAAWGGGQPRGFRASRGPSRFFSGSKNKAIARGVRMSMYVIY